MKNLSVRWRILGGVVAVNLIGALAVMVYLHQSYSRGLDVAAERAIQLGVNGWAELSELRGSEIATVTSVSGATAYAEHLAHLSGAHYGILVEKSLLDEAAYAAEREEAGLPDNWSEGDVYVLAGASDPAALDGVRFNATPDSVPEIGKMVGIENGACSKTCHGAMTAEGDYWTVAWSKDSSSRAHGVFPIADAKGAPVGVVYLIQDISVQANRAKDTMMQTLVVFALTMLVATVVIGGMLDALVFKRLSAMMSSMEDISTRVAGGDFDAHFVASGTTDEIGTFETFFGKFIDTMTGTIKSLVRK